MGQYQQWLYYQEVDQRLHADLEMLEIELAHIQEQARTLEQTIPSNDNPIIRTLAISLNEHTQNSDTVLLGKRAENSFRLPDTTAASPHETISSALYDWGGLPNFTQEDIQQPFTQPEDAIPLTPHPEMLLLPEDMAAFFDEHEQTAPQLALPRWLSKGQASSNNAHSEQPIDQGSIRTNTQVQRWRERWGRPTSTDLVDAEEQLIASSDPIPAHETTRQTNPQALGNIYAKLKAQDIEQFYTGYLWWKFHQRSVTLESQQAALRQEIAANAELMEMVHPPAIALATMARLQASGMSDIDLLDHMLEKGELWLDRTMQRLDYCEQLNFLIDDYSQWCRNALEGAYDWIDSMREGGTTLSTEVLTSDTVSNATEELLLQKLTSEEEMQSPSPVMAIEPSPSTLEETSTQIPEDTDVESLISVERNDVTSIEVRNEACEAPFNSFASQELGGETPPSHEEILPEQQLSQSIAGDPVPDPTTEDSIMHAHESQAEQLSLSGEINHTSDSPDQEAILQEDNATEPQPLEISQTSNAEESQPYRMYPPDKKPFAPLAGREHAEHSIPAVTRRRRLNLLQRLVAKIWLKELP